MASYPDVPQSHWAKTMIDMATLLGIMRGYPDGTFKPEQPITRAEAAAVAVHTVGAALLVGGGAAALIWLAASYRPGTVKRREVTE